MIKTTFSAILLAILLITHPTFAMKPGGNSGSVDPYSDEIHAYLQDWIYFTEEYGMECVAWAEFLIYEDGYSSEYISLESGFYEVWSQVDSRYAPEDMSIYVYNEEGELIGRSETEMASSPYCVFYISKGQEVTLECDVAGLRRNDEAYGAYMMIRNGGIDNKSRREYIATELDNLRMYAEVEGSTVIVSDKGTLRASDNTFGFSYDLLAGQFVLGATGGLAMLNLDITVYSKGGDVLFVDEYDNRFPVAIFELNRNQTVWIEITVTDFMGEFTEDYYCWCLSSIGKYEGAVG